MHSRPKNKMYIHNFRVIRKTFTYQYPRLSSYMPPAIWTLDSKYACNIIIRATKLFSIAKLSGIRKT